MNYIGSKWTLLDRLETVLDEAGVPRDGIALDLFAGTGAVAQALKRRGHTVYANDWQHYSYITNVAFLELEGLPEFHGLQGGSEWREIASAAPPESIPAFSILGRQRLTGAEPALRVVQFLNALPGREGAFYHTYCEGGRSERLYFSAENGRRIQAIRDRISNWATQGWLTHAEQCWLIAGLVEAADQVANTASVYGAYLKRVKPTARRPMELVALLPSASPQPGPRHRAWNRDSEEFLGEVGETCRLAYLDPPYNNRQYSANYHLLETLACWDLDEFDPRGVTGLRPRNRQNSPYCRRDAGAAFRRLLGRVRAEWLLFSYNNEGILTAAELCALLRERYREVQLEELPFRRFRADRDGANRVYSGSATVEYLLLGTARREAGIAA